MSGSFNVGATGANDRIFGEIVRMRRAGRRGALASPVRLTGSVPCGNQSRLLVREDGSILGTVGGGLLEAEVIRTAAEVMDSGEAAVLDFELTQNDASQAGMICGGSCSVLVEPVLPGRFEEVYAAAAECEADGRGIVLIAAFPDTGSFYRLALAQDGGLIAATGDSGVDSLVRDAARRLGSQHGPTLEDEPIRICIQPVHSTPPLYIFGAGHVAIPVAHIAKLVGFHTTVVDDRSEFANTARFPSADRVLAIGVDEAFSQLPIGEGAYVVAITRGHYMDEAVVAHALRTPAKYIGMIGSKRKVATVFERLHERGFSDTDLARIHAPIGYEIGAETVDEIAVSIVAELVAVRRGNT